MTIDEEFEELLERARRMALGYVERGTFLLNPDQALLERVLAGLARNEARFGHRYCP